MSNNAEKKRRLAELQADPFNTPNWAGNQHSQTILGRYGRTMLAPTLILERWQTPDDDFLRVHYQMDYPGRPIVIISHGLEGSVKSSYVTTVLHALTAMKLNVLVFEQRSCGGEMNFAKRLYHSGETTDLAFVVNTTAERWPDHSLFLVGYSLGGNQIAKWLGESAKTVPPSVKAAAVISVPFDLATSAHYMDTGLRRLYVKHFLKKLIPKAIEKEKQHPGSLDISKIKLAKSFRDFDNHATAPLHGFADAAAYYRHSGCGQYIAGITRPTLFISAQDDPFNPASTIPQQTIDDADLLYGLFPERGGHVGFHERQDTASQSTIGWLERQIGCFFSFFTT